MSLAPASPRYTKDQPFLATITESRLLTKAGSGKETRHFVVNIAGSDLTYKPGDSLGVFATNNPAIVDELIELLGASPDAPVRLPRSDTPVPLRTALLERLSLAQPMRKTLELFASRATATDEREQLARLLAPDAKEELARFLANREFIDLLSEFPTVRRTLTPQEFVEQLRRINPRLYSIASSQRMFPDEVHLTVAIVRYTTNNRERGGLCTTFLADRIEVGRTQVPVFVADSHFGLPANDDADVIMVGPGTGVAPFRAFLQERAVRGARGRNWLFFGEQRHAFDFLYEEEFESWREQGVLQRLDTAFSRDQAYKIYVQDRMREQGAELWRWLQAGAYFYVCGDAKRMAKDVDQALHEVVAQHGSMDAAQAADYVKALKREKRYQRDVY